MARFIRSVRYAGKGFDRPAHSSEMFELFGLAGQTKWPDAGMPLRFIQGIAVHVLPVDHVSLKKRPGVKSSKHRVIASCPDCGKAMSAGRLHQHVCPPKTVTHEVRERLNRLGRDAVFLAYGSQRQIDADNAFHDRVRPFLTEQQATEWDVYAHKATVFERVEWAFERLGMYEELARARADLDVACYMGLK